jgi:hypothetical protein
MVFVVGRVRYTTEVNEERRRRNEQTESENVVFSNVRTKVVRDFFSQCLG